MKKIISRLLMLTTSFMLLVTSGKSQERIAIHDALTLAEIYKTNNSELFSKDIGIAEILNYYYGGSVINTDQNPFLDPYFTDGALAGVNTATIYSGLDNESGKSIFKADALTGLDVTTITQGLAQFMIERAKEELTVAFFEKFEKFSRKTPEFEALFPKTTETLRHLLASHYSEMIPALREAFYDDLKNVLVHIDDLMALDKYRNLLENFPELRLIIKSIQFFIQKIEIEKSSPDKILKEYSEFSEWEDVNASNGLRNMGSSIKLSNILSQGLLNNNTSSTWVPLTKLQELLSNKNKIAFEIFVGLIYQRANTETIRFYLHPSGHKDLTEILIERKDNLLAFHYFLVEFIESAEKMEQIKNDLSQQLASDKKIGKDDFYEYFNISISIIESGFDLYKIFDSSLDLDGYIKIAKKSNELFRSIYKEQYAVMVINLMDILNETIDIIQQEKAKRAQVIKNSLSSASLPSNASKGLSKILKDVKRNGLVDKRCSSKNIERFRKELKSFGGLTPDQNQQRQQLLLSMSLKQYGKLDKTIGKITKYGLFIANMAQADSPEEVKDILNNVVLPVGSSSIKKNAKFNISIQSYLGAYYIPSPNSDDQVTSWNDPFGVHAPIGVAFSKGFRNWGSLSAFASLLDIGAVVDYELKSEEVTHPDGSMETAIKKDYKVQLGQIFSPGAYLVYGFPCKLPLAFGVGGQYGPGLSKLDSDGTSVVNAPKWRTNIFLSVDIPFFNLLNNRRNYTQH